MNMSRLFVVSVFLVLLASQACCHDDQQIIDRHEQTLAAEDD